MPAAADATVQALELLMISRHRLQKIRRPPAASQKAQLALRTPRPWACGTADNRAYSKPSEQRASAAFGWPSRARSPALVRRTIADRPQQLAPNDG